MAGMLPFTDTEIQALTAQLRPRDRALLLLGVTTGFRISELLSLSQGDVWTPAGPRTHVTVARRHTKRKQASRTKPIHPLVKVSLARWIESVGFQPDRPLFASRKGAAAITHHHAFKIINEAAKRAGITKRVGTHSLRKTYAMKVWEGCENYLVVRDALGHRSVASTECYLRSVKSDPEIQVTLSLADVG